MSRRLGRRTRYVLAAALTLAALPAVPALAQLPDGTKAGAPAAEDPAGATAHLDAVERALREVSPGLEGSVWQRTDGNLLDPAGSEPAGWLLQTPGCWGDHACTDRPGTHRLLARMTEDVAAATRTVDLSTLAPFPDGGFQDALVAGLKRAAATHKLRVRILVGAVPVGNLNVVPAAYRNELVRKLGPAADNITLNVASMTTSKTAMSWNHSKILLVDGRTAIVGGVNNWSGDYLASTQPVTDVSLALSGPAAASAGRYLDTLWSWTCRNSGNPLKVWLASSPGAGCLADLEREANPTPPAPTGSVPVIAVGSLGVGISKADPKSTYRPGPVPAAPDTRCGIALPDRTNADRDYATVNPDESALRALVGSASRSVTISQQDLHGFCPPLPRYDVRLYDALAGRLAAGVKVRIVLSDPANSGPLGVGGYSMISSLTEVSDALRARLARITGSQAGARTAMCRNLQLASFRSAPQPTFAGGKPYRLHDKVVLVDDATFYLGSKNLYPAWLQDFGYVVASPAAAAQLRAGLLDPQWTYSQATATFDHANGRCPA